MTEGDPRLIEIRKTNGNCYLFLDEDALKSQKCPDKHIDAFKAKVAKPIFGTKSLREIDGNFIQRLYYPGLFNEEAHKITHEIKIGEEYRAYIVQIKAENSNKSLYWACGYGKALHATGDVKNLAKSDNIVNLLSVEKGSVEPKYLPGL